MKPNLELEKFNSVLQKIMSVPREELMRREKAWKKEQARKKKRRIDNDIATKKND